MDKTQKHQELCEKLHETYVKKNHDYGDSFGKTYEKLGIISALTRMSDKWERITNLVAQKEQMVNDESLVDSLMDISNYALMTIIEIENEGNK